MSVLRTKSYAERLTAAIEKSDKESDPEQAVYILKCALQAEIALANKITCLGEFRNWFEGECYNMQLVRGRK